MIWNLESNSSTNAEHKLTINENSTQKNNRTKIITKTDAFSVFCEKVFLRRISREKLPVVRCKCEAPTLVTCFPPRHEAPKKKAFNNYDCFFWKFFCRFSGKINLSQSFYSCNEHKIGLRLITLVWGKIVQWVIIKNIDELVQFFIFENVTMAVVR